MSTIDDKTALRAMRNGDEQALSWLIDRYTPYVSAIVWNILSRSMSAPDMEEVCADVFTALWRGADRIRTDSARAYLSGIARNLAVKKLRERREELALEEDELILDRDTPESVAERRELAGLVRKAVDALTPEDREIFLRHYYYGQTVSQISRETGMNPSTVKTRLRRGREKLKIILSTGGSTDENENLRSHELPAG